MQNKLPPSQTPGAIELDFTGVFNLKDLRPEPPPPPAPKPRPVPKEFLVGAKSLAKNNYYVNMTRPRPPRKVDPEKTTILLVEDDATTRNVLGLILTRSEGYLIRMASDVQTFVVALQKPPLVDVIILDIELPGNVSGFKILAKIRAHPSIRNVPVIIFSGHSEPADLQQGIVLGADAYLSKPAKVEAILAAVKAVLGAEAPLVLRVTGPWDFPGVRVRRWHSAGNHLDASDQQHHGQQFLYGRVARALAPVPGADEAARNCRKCPVRQCGR